MKRLIITIITFTMALVAEAQIQASHIFNGKSSNHMSSSCIEGNSLKPYKLTLFSTVTTRDRRLFEHAEEIIAISKSFGVDAQIIGRVEAADKNELIIESPYGTFKY